ncbi:GrpB family protein [Aridibaculum aurantiacum]|uniref:GrpB family protein n=1 Tax=Aridibaculum aurantiacum TaxID=2810307 RepID=UPI001A96F804|nr:GrpB family protein [Aridibaculum aurantiacum]
MSNEKIIIEEYSPNWASVFQQLRSIYLRHLADVVTDVQHVGSTSVVGLAAKPIIDIDLVIPNRENLVVVIKRLHLLGYDHRGDLGIKDREAFKRRSDHVPFDPHIRTWPNHHLYVCPSDSIALKNHLALRDFLFRHPAQATAYGELKKRLALEHPYDIDRYIEGKTPFITGVLRAVGFDQHALNDIARDNSLANLKSNR